ncbi:hypothetical protein L914_14537 [Phytophthora nicotianae]|uniref:Uncharacterized protein n=2 Tax=Phytophthora nicotianae TaxID=4792 RepID=V9EL80_PHYNI|nr:hypothetical protein F443_15138 [Phytophthora nicotianae P1569]ETM39305.1 hypothetical protein L914_14537 [Phytophthora nicotianae]
MDTCALYPPNSQRFSDDVIAGVVQRVRRSDSPHRPHPDEQKRLRKSLTTSKHAPSSRANALYTADIKRTLQKSRASGSGTLCHDEIAKTLAQIFLSEQVRLRELRRLRQVRYRMKKGVYVDSLDEETRRLREVIKELDQQRCAVFNVAPTADSVWGAAAAYFRVFQHGYDGTSEQEGFVRSTMAPDVALNVGYGPEAFIKVWKSLTAMFEDVELELVSLDQQDAGSLVAATITKVTIADHTLRNVFPDLHSREDAAGLKLVEKLQGQQISIHGTTRFLWDPVYRRISSVMAQSDILTPMLCLVGSLENVSLVFKGASVTLDFQLKPNH